MKHLLIVVCILSCLSSFAQKTIDEKMAATANGKQMPDFSIKDLEGNDLKFSALKAEVIVLDVWASWCGPCRKEAPYFHKIKEELESDQVQFISIAIDKRYKKWLNYMEGKEHKEDQYWAGDASNHPIEWLTYAIEPISKTEEALVAGVPRFVIVKKGKIINRNADFASRSLKTQIEKVIGEGSTE